MVVFFYQFLKRSFYFIWKAQKEREIFQPLAQSPNDCNLQGWARCNSGAWSFFQVPDMGAGPETLWLSTIALPGPLMGTWIGSRAAGTPCGMPVALSITSQCQPHNEVLNSGLEKHVFILKEEGERKKGEEENQRKGERKKEEGKKEGRDEERERKMRGERHIEVV